MYREVRDEVAYWAKQIRTRDLLRVQCDGLRKHHARLLGLLEEASKRVDAERGDIERLEEKSFERLFERLRGRLDERIDKERKELAEAELRYTELLQLEEAARAEIAAVEEEIGVLGPVEQRHTEAFREKAAAILARGDEVACTVSAMVDRITAAQAFDFELGQAAQAGHNVIALIDAAMTILTRTSGAPYNADFFTQMEHAIDKGRKLDRAARAVGAAKLALVRLQSELADVHQRIELPAELDDFVRAARHALYSPFPETHLPMIVAQGQRDLTALRQVVQQAIQAVYQQHTANNQRLDAQWKAYQSAVSMA